MRALRRASWGGPELLAARPVTGKMEITP